MTTTSQIEASDLAHDATELKLQVLEELQRLAVTRPEVTSKLQLGMFAVEAQDALIVLAELVDGAITLAADIADDPYEVVNIADQFSWVYVALRGLDRSLGMKINNFTDYVDGLVENGVISIDRNSIVV